MRTSSSRLRTGAAATATALVLVLSFGTPAFADHSNNGGNGSGHSAGGPNENASGNGKSDDAGNAQPGDSANGSGRPTDTNPDDHPSGQDKSVEPGGSDTQGSSGSDPDGLTNGGADKPGEVGGFDADKDGNNGCGNDDDFEDDNRGNCGGPEKVRGNEVVKTEDVKPVVTESAVLGSSVETGSPAPQAAEVARTNIETRVLGVSIERDTAAAPSTPTAVLGASATRGAALARTGFGLTFLAIAGLLLILAGFGLKRSGRSTI